MQTTNDCDHEDYEIDLVTGRAECPCGHSWWASTKQIDAEIERHRAYYEWCEEQERPWNRFKEWARQTWRSLRIRLRYGVKIRWPSSSRNVDLTDEIPF